MIGFLLSDDLMFTSRVTGTARDLGLTIKPARSSEILEKLAQQQAPSCVIVDLANPGLNLIDLIGQLRAACGIMPRIVAYGSHVDAAGLQAARAAGCDVVLPRSAFVAELPRKLADWMGSEANQ
jgi:CheY-like chemotaxis protein